MCMCVHHLCVHSYFVILATTTAHSHDAGTNMLSLLFFAYLQMDGYLQKQSSGRFKRWQRRWFEVDFAYLRYFADEGQPTPKAAVSVDAIVSCTRTGVRFGTAYCLLIARWLSRNAPAHTWLTTSSLLFAYLHHVL